MKTSQTEFRGHKLSYVVFQVGGENQLLLNSRDICAILQVDNQARSQTRLALTMCDLADASLYATERDIDFFEFLTSEFDGYPLQCDLRPRIDNDG